MNLSTNQNLIKRNSLEYDNDKIEFKVYDEINNIKKVKYNNESEYELDCSDDENEEIIIPKYHTEKEKNIYIICSTCKKKKKFEDVGKRNYNNYYSTCKECREKKNKKKDYDKTEVISIINTNLSNNDNLYICKSCHYWRKSYEMGINKRNNKLYLTCNKCRYTKKNKYKYAKQFSISLETLPEGCTRCLCCGEIRKYEEMGINKRKSELRQKCLYCRKGNSYNNKNDTTNRI